MVLAVGRAVERVLADAMFGVSLVLGWNLFRVGVINDQTAELSAKGWKVRLQKVGPGIFFALFGAVGLCIAIQKPLTIDSEKTPALGAVPAVERFQTEYAYKNTEVPQYITALTTVEEIGIREDGTHSAEKDALLKAKPILEQYRTTLLKNYYPGPKGYEWYLTLYSGSPVELNKLSPSEKTIYDAIDRTANTTFATNSPK
jgi:hypothetical protein